MVDDTEAGLRAEIAQLRVLLKRLKGEKAHAADNEAAACRALAFHAVGLIVSQPANLIRKTREMIMAKAYWVATYFSISNPDALAEYAKLAGPAIAAAGGKFLARGAANFLAMPLLALYAVRGREEGPQIAVSRQAVGG